jgi:hypothetical protein
VVSKTIDESGMKFNTGNQDYYFLIEKSKIYQRIKKGIEIAEFLYLREYKGKRVIYIIEAKTSAPHIDNEIRFPDYIDEITNKFVNTFNIYLALILGRHKSAKDEMPEKLRTIDLCDVDFSFLLVINKAKKEWLPAINDAVNKQIRIFIKTKIWTMSSTPVIVLNAELAKQKSIIL